MDGERKLSQETVEAIGRALRYQVWHYEARVRDEPGDEFALKRLEYWTKALSDWQPPAGGRDGR